MGSFVHLRVRAAVLATVLLCSLPGGRCLRPSPGDGDVGRGITHLVAHKEGREDDLVKGKLATGSSLPDCSHACGPCTPCRRVMVTFKCSIAESCPIVYRCMCRGRYYQVPSN